MLRERWMLFSESSFNFSNTLSKNGNIKSMSVVDRIAVSSNCATNKL